MCSELCGVNHGFMPIAIQVVSKDDFATWVKKAQIEFASDKSRLIGEIRIADAMHNR